MISNEKRYLCLQKSLNVLVLHRRRRHHALAVASSQLALMIGNLTVSEFDLQALNEFKSVLCNG